MRKLLSILAAVGLTATSATGVVACSSKDDRTDRTAVGTQKAILLELLNKSEIVFEKSSEDGDSLRELVLKTYSQGKELYHNQRASVDRIYEINKSLAMSINDWLANSSFADQDQIKKTIENLAKKADKEYVSAKLHDLSKRVRLIENKTSDLSATDISAIKKELNGLQPIIEGDRKTIRKANDLNRKIVGLEREVVQNLQVRVLNLTSDDVDYHAINKIQNELKELSSVVDKGNSGLNAAIGTLEDNLNKLRVELAQKIDKEDVEQQIGVLRDEMDQLRGNDVQKASQIKTFANRIQNLAAFSGDGAEFKEAIQSLNNQLEILSSQFIAGINQKIANLENQTNGLKVGDIRTLQNDIETLMGALITDDEKSRELGNSLVKSMRNLTTLEVVIGRQMNEKKAEQYIRDVEIKFNALNRNDDVSSSDLGYLRTWIDSIENIVSRREFVNELQPPLGRWKFEVERLTKVLLAKMDRVAAEAEFKQVSQNLEKLSSQQLSVDDFVALQNQLVILGQLVGQLKDDHLAVELANLQDRVNTLLNNETIDLSTRVKTLEDNLRDLTVQDVNELKTNLETLAKIVDQNNTNLLAKINGLTTNLEQLRILANQKADKEYVDQQFKTLEDQIAGLNDQIKDIRSNDLKNLQTQLDDLAKFVGKTGDQGLNQKLLGLSQEVRDLTTKTITDINTRLEKLENDFDSLNPEEIQNLKKNLKQLTDLVTGKGGLQDRLDVLEKKIIRGIGWNSGEVSRNDQNTNWNFLELKDFLGGTTTMWVFHFLATSQNDREAQHRMYTGTTLISEDMFRDKNEVLFNIGFTAWSNGIIINDYIRGWFKKSGSDLFVSMHPYDNNSPSWIYSTLKITWSAVN